MGQACSQNNGASNPVMIDHAYSHDIKNSRVLLLGPYPPPWGGIAVHIQRVKYKLELQGNAVVVFDTISRTSFLRYLMQLIRILYCNRFDYAIYHTPYTDYSWVEMIILIFYAALKSAFFMLIEHDCRYIMGKSWLAKKVFSWIYAWAHKVVFMGFATYVSYKKAGIKIQTQYTIESPFLPPCSEQIDQQYPAELMSFIQSHQPLLVMNAYQCILVNGHDLYGIDDSIALCKKLQHQFPHVGLVLFLATIGDLAYYQQIVDRLDEHIYMLNGDYQLWPIFKYSDCFIRPTRNENFGISVAEALYCQVPVVASNVCMRPQGTILYQAADLRDLVSKTTQILQSLNESSSQGYF